MGLVAHQIRIVERSAIGRDVAADVTRLHAEYYGPVWQLNEQFVNERRDELSQFERDYNPADDGMWLALAGDEIVGSIAIQRAMTPCARLRWFIVTESIRGRKIGAELLERALAFCRAAGTRTVELWTFAGLEGARVLYERAGFVLMEEESFADWGPTIWARRYELELGGQQ